MFWQTSRYSIDLGRPQVMAIVNVTPDSFSDGGRYMSSQDALARCEQAIREGADILDIGGESSRPGTPPVSLEEERARVLPVLRAAVTLGVPVSLDTYKPEVMRDALDLGVDIINDIWSLRWPGAREAVLAHPNCGICLMHMHGEPQTMQREPMAGDAVPQVRKFLLSMTEPLLRAGVDPRRIAWDAGVGFGKTVAQNFALMARQRELLAHGYPLLVGWSRKSSLGSVTGEPVDRRMAASVAAAVLSAERGARIIRVHDVRETAAALKVWAAMTAQDTTRENT